MDELFCGGEHHGWEGVLGRGNQCPVLGLILAVGNASGGVRAFHRQHGKQSKWFTDPHGLVLTTSKRPDSSSKFYAFTTIQEHCG